MPFQYAAFTVMTPEYGIEEVAALLKRLGYDGVEWRVHTVPGAACPRTDSWRCNRATVGIDTIVEKAKEIRKISEDHGLEIMSLGTYLSYKLIEDIQRCMEAARIMGCGSIRVSAPKYDRSQNYNDIFEQAMDGFAKVEALAAKHNVRACVELHYGNICSSASLGHRLVSNFDPYCIGVIYDPGNLVFEGHEDPRLAFDLLGPYLAYVHVKNAAWVQVDGADHGGRLWRPTIAPLKEGFVPWREILSDLDKSGFNGWLSLEDFGPGDAKTKLADGIAYLKSLDAQVADGG